MEPEKKVKTVTKTASELDRIDGQLTEICNTLTGMASHLIHLECKGMSDEVKKVAAKVDRIRVTFRETRKLDRQRILLMDKK